MTKYKEQTSNSFFKYYKLNMHETPFSKVLDVGKVTILFVLLSTLIYYIIGRGNWNILDCFYMVIITITTVGYSEILDFEHAVYERLFSIIVVLWGYILLVYFVSLLSKLFVTGEIKKYLKKNKVKKMIKSFKNHYIICGFDEMGKHVAREIYTTFRKIVIIDQKPDIDRIVCKFFNDDIPTICGDASDEEVLIESGVSKAAAMILTLPEDKDNLFVLVTAKNLRPDLCVAAKVVHEKNLTKFINAGASKVVSPSKIGGLRLASEVIRPSVTTFLDRMLRDKDKDLRIDEIMLDQSFDCIGKPLGKSNFKDRTNALILAVEYPDGNFVYNPPSSLVLKEGQKLIVLGELKEMAMIKGFTFKRHQHPI